MRLVCISDTHGRHAELTIPEGDLLLHAGDFSKRGKPSEIEDFNAWLKTLPHPHKIVIAGNHDFLFEQAPEQARKLLNAALYLEDSGVEIDGLKIWGSPVSPRFFDWAFNRSRGEEIRRHWQQIPHATDLVLVHGPPAGILDKTWLGQSVGCKDLNQALAQIRPKAVVFGHIHESYGVLKHAETLYINASSLDRHYRPQHPPVVLEWSNHNLHPIF
ncbi:metallophosphoesterase [bacterium (Candidatus Blackallbacteria) CG17_big_fil_post_rev_8_21_14_2_50_48_46]|uniref:Metallophosphoesterase n=1 Tax=bacterium (Candidatus Blackallbacteria) CG17_big_fil_post_rev_8_21_14_2_50_48_46 TaxID=2014261 RepID=A0A2M7FXY9_9BACT|nr:MAG: metallophosphoesterase [bacterium (Candidatus Blackallbacteria) CG18_big_fil_WC_8_21_14_2_50_49_26]PIW14137.1 MAG: metallophosphoesterase [bacterium (Candidatus Blackallbacteria) CG17_big_fil_post_rev_8_21_14_2_50_48_46]PIW45867.1 MAG: metallophosphoesterase [bacterium (Candidatus Blackallbacteria) CG13_big_fil_rev_8_21_14_2_50_49_14]